MCENLEGGNICTSVREWEETDDGGRNRLNLQVNSQVRRLENGADVR